MMFKVQTKNYFHWATWASPRMASPYMYTSSKLWSAPPWTSKYSSHGQVHAVLQQEDPQSAVDKADRLLGADLYFFASAASFLGQPVLDLCLYTKKTMVCSLVPFWGRSCGNCGSSNKRLWIWKTVLCSATSAGSPRQYCSCHSTPSAWCSW